MSGGPGYPLRQVLPAEVLVGGNAVWSRYRQYPVFSLRWLAGRSLLFCGILAVFAAITGMGVLLLLQDPVIALKVGLVQCAALIPGTSRSGATIIGSMIFGFSRKAATEFSFYLGIPTLIGAGAYSLWKQRDLLSLADVPMFAVGLAFAFISALLCIRWLIRYVSTHDFTVFAWYRVILAIGVLVYLGA